MTKRLRTGGRLMYTSHPPDNHIPFVPASRLSEAVNAIHSIKYDSLVNVWQTIRELAIEINTLGPDLVVFFATGGIPIVFPILHCLSDAGRYDLTDGSVFHMFPGLAWDGNIGDKKPMQYFVDEIGEAIRSTSKSTSRSLRQIVAIDTTNSGNAVNLAVQSLFEGCKKASVNPDITVYGVVNNAARPNLEQNLSRRQIRHLDGSHSDLLVPTGFRPTEDLVERRPAVFVGKSENVSESKVVISYWFVDELFTEDCAELIGIAAIHKHLKVVTSGTAGRMRILFENGRVLTETGLDAVGRRLIRVLSAEHSQMPWSLYIKVGAMPTVSSDEDGFFHNTELDREAFQRLFEIENDECGIKSILNKKGLLSSIDIYYLKDHSEFSSSAVRKVFAALNKAIPEHSDEAKQTIIEAAAYFRSIYKIETDEPESNEIPELKEFWIKRIDQLKRNPSE